MKKFTVFLMLLVLSISAAFAQRTVRGLVVDVNHEPLPGASILIKDTQAGVATDIDGAFTITAKSGDILQVSYMGFESTEAKVPSKGDLRITLKETETALDEIVVVGVSMKKSDLTGAVSHIDSEVLTEKPVTNINDAISGRIAGVNISKSSSPWEDSGIKIRGTNTINAGSAPIYVVDGLVMGNEFGFYNTINVNDVESIEVLKDASATAIYGSRGANGVIIVTTKKGKKGKGEVTYDGWVSWAKPGHRPEVMGAQDLFNLRKEAYANGYMYNHPDADREKYINDVILGTNNVFSDEEKAGFASGNSYDWLDQVTRTGFEQNHNVSFSKATESTNFYFSLGLNDLKGIMKGTDRQRYTGRINASADITSWLKVGTNTSYTYTRDEMTDGSVYSQALYNGNPLIDYAPYMDDATRKDEDHLTLYWRVHNEESNNNFNPFNSFEIVTDRSRYHLTSSNYININPIKGLNIRSTFSINRGEQSWNQFIPTGIQQSIRHHAHEAYATQQRFGETQWQWDNTVSYDKTFNNVHRLNAFGGYSMSRSIYNDLKGSGQRFASNDLGYDGLFGNANIGARSISNSFAQRGLMSYVLRGNYSYDYRYYITLTGRWDGSSKFAEGHRWGFFPSFSVAWDLTNEKFFPKNWAVNQIKIRAGYGTVGNQDIGDFMYTALYYPNVTIKDGDGIPSYNTDHRRGTPDITWEKQKQTNIGLDLAFLDNRLRATMDAFFINNSNLLLSHSLATSSGYTYTVENVGELSNKGFELSISGTPIRTRDFEWNITANLALDRNKVKKLYGGVERILSGDRYGNIFIGESLSNLYTLKAGGIANESNRELWEGKNFNGHTIGLGDLFPLDLSGKDGKPDGSVDLQYDRYIKGNMDPKVYGGFSTDLTWKGLSLNAVFSYKLGGHTASGYYEGLISSTGTSNASPDLADSWTPTNTGAFFPRRIADAIGYAPYGAAETDRYIQSNSFLRLNTLSLSYSLPAKVLKKIRMNNLRLYFTASNVFTVTKYKGFDPEWGDGNGYFPSERAFTLGLSFSVL